MVAGCYGDRRMDRPEGSWSDPSSSSWTGVEEGGHSVYSEKEESLNALHCTALQCYISTATQCNVDATLE